MLTRQKHTGEPSFGLTWLQGVKGKPRLQAAREGPEPPRGPRPQQVCPHAPPPPRAA